MPFAISGNVSRIERDSLRRLERKLGIILSPNQPTLQQKKMIQRGLHGMGGLHNILESLTKRQLLSLIFLITQFGDITLEETPAEYTDLEDIPYIVEWKKNHFMIPLEILELLSNERLFKEQGYLFALIPSLLKEEKTAWIKWIGADYEPNKERSIDFEIHYQCRLLQKPFNGKSLIQDTEFSLIDVWPFGSCQELDWYYKGLTTFYYSLQELAKREKDPFKRHVIDVIRCGKFILKKTDRYTSNMDAKIVASVEGATPQLRESLFHWEKNKDSSLSRGLFS
jgi:hypothetical protein